MYRTLRTKSKIFRPLEVQKKKEKPLNNAIQNVYSSILLTQYSYPNCVATKLLKVKIFKSQISNLFYYLTFQYKYRFIWIKFHINTPDKIGHRKHNTQRFLKMKIIRLVVTFPIF